MTDPTNPPTDPAKHDDSEEIFLTGTEFGADSGNPDSRNSESGNSESRGPEKISIAAFLRQAAAVIAAERGLNATSHQKLRNLATHLKMPEEEFLEAMEKLQEKEKLPSGLNRYEKEFVTFIRNKFLNLKSGIMSVGMEERAIDLAARKYQILGARAQQLIHDQAEKLGIGRISKSEAEKYVEELITSRIGDATRIEDEARDRFYKIGLKWGAGQDQVDAIMLQALADNRKLETPEESRGVGLAISFLFLLMIGIGAFVTIYAMGLMDDSPVIVEETTEDTDDKPVANAEKTNAIPEWWADADLKTLTSALLKEQPEHQAMVDELVSEDIELQKAGLQKLVSLAQGNNGSETQDSIDTLCQFYYYSPEREVVGDVVTRLADDVSLPHSRLPASEEKFKSNYGANRLLSKLKHFSSLRDEPRIIYRREAIEKVIANEFGSRNLGDQQIDYLATTNRVVAINQWNHLIQTSWSSPGRTSTLIAPLYNLTRTRLRPEELQRLHGRTVMAVLEADQKYWWDLKPEIENAVKNSSSVAINTWINHHRTITKVDYAVWLGTTLARKCGINPEGKSREAIADELEAVRYRINRERFSELISRNEQLEPLNRQMINSYRRTRLTPQKIVDLVRLTNLNMLLAPEDQASFLYGKFDKLLAKEAPDLVEMTAKLFSQNEFARNRERPTQSDYRTLDEVFEKLENLDSDQSSARVSALRQLAEIAVRFEDIPYTKATRLSEYYLTERGGRETVGAEKYIKQFSTWPSFAVAVADQIESSDAKLDQAITLAQVFSEGNFQIDDPVEWKAEIAAFVFQAAVDRSQTMTRTVSRESQQWEFLREYLTRLYGQRLNQLGERSMMETKPSGLVEKMILRLNAESQQQVAYPVERAIELVKRQSQSELEELVGLNKIFVKLLSQRITDRWPNRYAEVESLIQSFENLNMTDRDLAEELLDSEMVLLSLWSIEREAIAQRLISR